MNRPKQIGTAAETAVVRAIRPRGFPGAERRALRGTADAGDITGTPGICWSVKGGAAAKFASDAQVEMWLSDLDEQIINAGATTGLLVLQRPGIGPANGHRWWAIIRSYRLEQLTGPGGAWHAGYWFPVRMLLGDACLLLTTAGYGTRPGVE